MDGRHIKGYGALILLLVLLVLALPTFSCGESSGAGNEDETTGSSTAETTEPTEATTPADGAQTTASVPSAQTTTQSGSSSTVGSGAALNSYRIHTVWRDGSDQGPIKDEWTTEYLADPPAVDHKAAGDMDMEMIFVGKTLWTRFMDQPWRQVELAEEEAADWASMLSQAESPVDVEEQTPLEDDISG